MVVPVLDEAENIEPLVREIAAALDGVADYEILYVDDGSTDDTPARLAELQRQLPPGRLRVLRHHRTYGQTTALRSGARAARAPWIATLDGDGQNDPADIPKLLAVRDAADAPANLQLVTSLRRKRRDSWIRRLSSRIANGVRRRLLHDRTTDTGSGLKLLARDAFLDLPYFDHLHRFIPALILRGGGEMRTVEVSHRSRRHGESKYGIRNRLWVGIVDLLGVMWLQRRHVAPRVEELGPDLAGEPARDPRRPPENPPTRNPQHG